MEAVTARRRSRELLTTLVIQMQGGGLTAHNKETGECYWAHPLPHEARLTALRMDGWAEVSSDRFQYLINTRNGESLRRRKHANRVVPFAAHRIAIPLPAATEPQLSLGVTRSLSKRSTKR